MHTRSIDLYPLKILSSALSWFFFIIILSSSGYLSVSLNELSSKKKDWGSEILWSFFSSSTSWLLNRRGWPCARSLKGFLDSEVTYNCNYGFLYLLTSLMKESLALIDELSVCSSRSRLTSHSFSGKNLASSVYNFNIDGSNLAVACAIKFDPSCFSWRLFVLFKLLRTSRRSIEWMIMCLSAE